MPNNLNLYATVNPHITFVANLFFFLKEFIGRIQWNQCWIQNRSSEQSNRKKLHKTVRIKLEQLIGLSGLNKNMKLQVLSENHKEDKKICKVQGKKKSI